MADQERALRLADELEAWTLGKPTHHRDAAAELRRLHGLDFALRDCELALQKMATKYMDAVDQRDALLEALKLALSAHGVMLLSDPPQEAWKTYGVEQKARAAIARAEGEKT